MELFKEEEEEEKKTREANDVSLLCSSCLIIIIKKQNDGITKEAGKLYCFIGRVGEVKISFFLLKI